jgi:hypothetical protein
MKVSGWKDDARQVIPNLPPPPDLDRYREETVETVRALIGINPQEVLDLYLASQQRAAKVRDRITEVSSELASYKARYWASGQGSSFSDLDRKALLARLMQEERNRRTSKVTVAELEDYAHSHRQYLEYLKAEEKGRWEMERLQAQLSGLRNDLETALGVVEYYSKAHKSCESMVWFAREENKKTF